MAHSATKAKHTPSAKLALEDVLKSLQDLIRNDLPASEAAPGGTETANTPGSTDTGPAEPTASDVLRELEAELEAMPSADELDLSSLDLSRTEDYPFGTETGAVEEITLAEPPAAEEITLQDVPATPSEYLQDNAASGADLSDLSIGGMDLTTDLPNPESSLESFLEIEPQPLQLEPMADNNGVDHPLSEYLQEDAPSNVELSSLENAIDFSATALSQDVLSPPTLSQPALSPIDITDDFSRNTKPPSVLTLADAPAGRTPPAPAIPPGGLQTEMFAENVSPAAKPGPAVAMPAPAPDGAIPYTPAAGSRKPSSAQAAAIWHDIPVLEDAIEMPGQAKPGPVRTAPVAPAAAMPAADNAPGAIAAGNKPVARGPAPKNDQGHKIAIQVAARLNVELRRSGKRGLGSDIITRLARVLEETLAQPASNMDNTPKHKD